ncbi:hypothetical protein [Microbacterium sp.]|uniref:hypothetical protein n=1 Tax=Microbacterium sp. TaxID=51671 RepID=UPI0026012052|nr:hypothetical protein [Microbacterium sp.]
MSGMVNRLSDAIEPRFAAVRRALDAPERTPRTAVILGRVLGAGILICFATGIYSHLLQHPISWLPLPTRPVELYQWTQGAHVATGTALIPVLLGKLWVVYPRLFDWPPVRSVAQVFERASIALLVATALLQVVMGALNTFQWYPWPFSFTATHFAVSWLLVGAMAVHIGVKLPLIVRHWRRGGEAAPEDSAEDGDA